jgi:probable F420-dependent oxidoreductase
MEQLAYASLWASDHIALPWTIRSRYPYGATGDFPLPASTAFLEPLTTLALVGGATDRIKLGTTVLVLPHRHPVLAAKMLATLDHLTRGRVILGAGVGWMKEEIELFGVPHQRRGRWSDEALRIMRACWRDERVSYAGEFFDFAPLGMAPKPPRGTIPIWIGGHTETALRRVAELGDGWHAAFPASPAELGSNLGRLREICEKAGRDYATITLSCRIGLPAKRSADDLVADLRALRDLGIAHVVLEARALELSDMNAIYERFANDVRPRV